MKPENDDPIEWYENARNAARFSALSLEIKGFDPSDVLEFISTLCLSNTRQAYHEENTREILAVANRVDTAINKADIGTIMLVFGFLIHRMAELSHTKLEEIRAEKLATEARGS